MILTLSILDKNRIEIYQEYFVEKTYFSDLQIKTIVNSTPRLLNILILTSKADKNDFTSRMFTITNLWFHIIKYKEFFYLFITPTFYLSDNKPVSMDDEYKELISQVDQLINQCTLYTPHFDLRQNNFFKNNVHGLFNNFNKFAIKSYNELILKDKATRQLNIKSQFNKENGKYLVIGPASAGKSSIIAQFVSNWSLEQIKNIRPTINKENNSFQDSLLNHNFNLLDLGGQVQYTELHLKQPNLFKNVFNIIYVIDVQDTKRIDFTKQYLLDISEKIIENNEKTFFSIFLHKYDPEDQARLNDNVQMWIEWIDKNFSKLNLDYSYYLTSIKDDSAREAFARTLLLTLPYWFLALTIRDDLIVRSFNSLAPIIEDLSKITNKKEDEEINKELFNQSAMFGFATTKIIIKKWLDHLAMNNKEEKDQLSDKEINIKFDEQDSAIFMNFHCPLLDNTKYKDIQDYSSVCEITHGVITGLSQFIGLGGVEIQQTQIRNKAPECKFRINL